MFSKETQSSFQRHIRSYFVELILIGFSYTISVFFYSSHLKFAPNGLRNDVRIIFGIIFVVWSLSLWVHRSYHSMYRRDFLDEVWLLFKTVVFSSAAALAIVSFVGLHLPGSLFFLIFATLNYCFLLVYREFVKDLMRHHERMGYNKRYVLIVGADENARALAHTLSFQKRANYQVCGFLSDEAFFNNEKSIDGIPILGEASKLTGILRELVIDDVYFAAANKSLSEMENLMKVCDEIGVRFHVSIALFSRFNSEAMVTRLMGESLLTFMAVPADSVYLGIKRGFDIAVSAFLLVVLGPLFGLISLIIKKTSSGPIVFSQSRLGMNGRIFTMHKFRTMNQDAEKQRQSLEHKNELKGPFFKIKDDPRVTKFGRFLRKSSLDELPQLWNVLRGDMSLVGPRPSLPEEVKQFEFYQRRRMAMRPGVTCLWQINGRNHVTDTEQGLAMDLEYIDNWSLGLDFKILLQTVKVVLSGKGAY